MGLWQSEVASKERIYEDLPSGETKWTFFALVRSVSSVWSYMPANMLRASECGRAVLFVSMYGHESEMGIIRAGEVRENIRDICDHQPFLQCISWCWGYGRVVEVVDWRREEYRVKADYRIKYSRRLQLSNVIWYSIQVIGCVVYIPNRKMKLWNQNGWGGVIEWCGEW